MNRKLISSAIAAAAIALTAVPIISQAAPMPAPWQTIEQREVNLNARIDAGVRNRSLTAAEAANLRTRLRALESLEANYRRSFGLDARERADLDARFDQLSQSIRQQATDDQTGWNLPGWNGQGWTINGRWQTLEQRQADLNRRIDAGVRSGGISRTEEMSLRSEFNRILNLEHADQRNGLTARERADLDRQFDQLATRIRNESTDRNGNVGPGNGRGPGGNGPGGYGQGDNGRGPGRGPGR